MNIKIIDINKEFELFENCDFCDNKFAKYNIQLKDQLCDICTTLHNHPEIIEYLKTNKNIEYNCNM